MGIELGDGRGRALGLELAHIGRIVNDLPVQIVEAHPVVVDDADGADTGCRQIHGQRRADAAGADDENTRGFQLLLAFAADLLQHQLAFIAFDFVCGEHDRASVSHALGRKPRISAGGAEAAGAARGVAKLRDLDDGDMLHAGNNQLSDAVAAANGEGLGAVIDEKHHDLAAIIGIDGARAVEQRHAMLQGKS